MRFEFATAGRIVFGPGAAGEVPALAAAMGRRALVVTGRGRERAAALLEGLNAKGLEYEVCVVAGEPTTDDVRRGAQEARGARCDLVVAFGGGSVLDAGKAIAALMTNPGDVLDYLEVIGAGRAVEHAAAPCIAVPTTAGTGAEVTRTAVLASPEHGVKVSMRSPLMLPRVAVVDPLLTHSMPRDVTASTGLDALTQLIEAFTCSAPNALTDAICRDGLGRAARSLRRAWENGADGAAREDMALAALCGGLALANARLGAVHGMAGPLGGMISAPHGMICASLLAGVMAANVRALRSRAPEHPALGRYDEIARIVTGDAGAKAEQGAEWVAVLCADLGTASLGALGLRPEDIAAAVGKSQKASSMKGNPIALTDGELTEILRAAL